MASNPKTPEQILAATVRQSAPYFFGPTRARDLLRCPTCGWPLSFSPFRGAEGKYVCPVYGHDRLWTAAEVHAANTRPGEGETDRILRLRHTARGVDAMTGRFHPERVPPGGPTPEERALYELARPGGGDA